MWSNSSKKTSIPTVERTEFCIRNFSGGINNVISPSRLQDNESPDMLNISFSDDGTLQKRPGLRLQDDKTTRAEDGLLRAFEIKCPNNKSGWLLNRTNSLVYVSTTGKYTYIDWDRTYTDKPISGVQFMDKFFFVDGGSKIHYFKIDELESLTNPYIYWIKNPPSGYVPNPKPATTGIVKQEKNKDVHNYIDVWYEPCEYELEDGYKGINFAEFYPTLITTVKDRLYVSGNYMDNNMVYISDILEPHYFPASLPIQMPPNGDYVTAMHIFNNTLIIARNNDMYALHGNTNRTDNSESYSLKHINTHTGMPNDNCANIVHHFLFYVGTDGNCYKLSYSLSDTGAVVSKKLNTKIDFKLKPFYKNIKEIRGAHTGYEPVKGEWYVQIGDDTFVYNYNLLAWTRYKGVRCESFLTTNDSFYLARSNCMLYEFDNSIYYDYKGEQNVKIPIHSYWQSKDIDFGRPARVKQVRDTYIVSETFDHVSTDIKLRMNVDYVDVSKEHNIVGEASFWDEAKWDVNKFIGHNINRSYSMMIGRRGKVFSVYISNQGEFKGVYDSMPVLEEISKMDYNDVFYVFDNKEHILKYYKRGNYNPEVGGYHVEINEKDLFQPMKIHEFNGLYELKGYR